MEYNYELLRKCHGLRFRATIAGEPQEGIIKVTSEGVILCYGEEGPGYLRTFGRRDTLSFSEQTFPILPSDFEIVPRDPKTYRDWQVGDEIRAFSGNYKIIFRSGEAVAFKYPNEDASNIFTCCELFKSGYRLVLTDIEQQIIEERKRQEWTPQDGDICYAETESGVHKFIIIHNHRDWSLAYRVDSDEWSLEKDILWAYSTIRPATEDEKQQLFDAMAKEGKRWNAEKKVVEDIEPEDDEPADVQKMISDALNGYTPEGEIEGFPIEVVAKMLERQYEQCKVVDVSVFENDKIAGADDSGFTWGDTEEGFNFWWNVVEDRDFSEFFKKYPKAEASGAGMPFSFKRFDPVLVMDRDGDRWQARVFLRKEEDRFYVLSIGGGLVYYNQCIPLNEDTEKLMNTTKKYEG